MKPKELRRKPHCFIADCSSKVPDDETLVVPQISVNGQLGLPGDLNVDKDSKTNGASVLKDTYWYMLHSSAIIMISRAELFIRISAALEFESKSAEYR